MSGQHNTTQHSDAKGMGKTGQGVEGEGGSRDEVENACSTCAVIKISTATLLLNVN